jgi:hypothetical protein
MDQTGQRVGAAVFATDGSARHHLGRAAVAAGLALLAAWMIALALGVLGGFGSLPGLPSPQSKASNETGSPPRQEPAGVRVAAQRSAPAAHTRTPATTTVAPNSGRSTSPGSSPKVSRTQVAPSPTAATVTTPTTHGQGATTRTTTTGKPVGSPGNATGGSGAPGQLR